MIERTKPLELLVRELPPPLQSEVRDFIEFLLAKESHVRMRQLNGRTLKSRKFLRQDWADGLSAYRDQYSSLELQKKALEWRAK